MANVPVGAYAVWQLPTGTWKYAVVGTADGAGEEHPWIELAVQDSSRGISMVARLLGTGFDRPNGIKELIVQPAGDPAMRMPAEMISIIRSNIPDPMKEVRKTCDAGVEDLGTESVTVPAGTFRARHFRAANGEEMWIDVSLAFPVVKATTKQGDMVLLQHGADATTAITGPIQDMPGF